MGRRGELKKGALFLRVAASPRLRVRYAAHTLPTAHRTPQYVELHARSAPSFLRGAAAPEELIAVCSELKMPAMALLDNDGLYGAARFHLAAKKLDIKAHMGSEITVSTSGAEISNPRFQIPNSKPKRQNPKFKTHNSTFVL